MEYEFTIRLISSVLIFVLVALWEILSQIGRSVLIRMIDSGSYQYSQRRLNEYTI